MAHLIPFSYQSGDSLLHELDVRSKFFMVCMISIAMVPAGFPALIAYTAVLSLLFCQSGINAFKMLWNMKLFLLLLLFVFISRSISVEGPEAFRLFGIKISKTGVYTGLLVSLKFLLIMLSGLLFCATTRPAHVKHAVQWFLKPVPFVPEKTVAVIISIALSFMPQILKQRRKVLDAQTARCGDLNRNPVKKIIQQVLPMLKKLFISADHMILAMESRCYSEDRTDPEFAYSGKELAFILSGTVMALLMFFSDRLPGMHLGI